MFYYVAAMAATRATLRRRKRSLSEPNPRRSRDEEREPPVARVERRPVRKVPMWEHLRRGLRIT